MDRVILYSHDSCEFFVSLMAYGYISGKPKYFNSKGKLFVFVPCIVKSN